MSYVVQLGRDWVHYRHLSTDLMINGLLHTNLNIYGCFSMHGICKVVLCLCCLHTGKLLLREWRRTGCESIISNHFWQVDDNWKLSVDDVSKIKLFALWNWNFAPHTNPHELFVTTDSALDSISYLITIMQMQRLTWDFAIINMIMYVTENENAFQNW